MQLCSAPTVPQTWHHLEEEAGLDADGKFDPGGGLPPPPGPLPGGLSPPGGARCCSLAACTSSSARASIRLTA
eukprot:12889829-Prorocentrum_lima.AAC.1